MEESQRGTSLGLLPQLSSLHRRSSYLLEKDRDGLENAMWSSQWNLLSDCNINRRRQLWCQQLLPFKESFIHSFIHPKL